MAANEIAAAYVSIVPSMRGFRSSVSRELSGLDAEGQKAGRSIGGGMASGIKSAAGLIAGAVAAVGIGKFVAEAARASDATDKFKATMNFAGVDTSGIDKAKKAAKEYADQTVYDLPTIQNMLAQLASNGVKDYTGLTKAAGNLNAVAGGNADTFKSVAMVMTQTAGAGKLTTENWNQLADAIPGAAGPLMESLKKAGAYTGNFRDAMADGQITSDEFNAALMELGTKPVAVEAAKSTATFEGAIGNLQATINSGLMTALDGIKPAATGAITALSDGLGKAFEWTGQAARGLYDLFAKGDFSQAMATAFNVQEDSKFVDFLFTAKDSVHNFIAGVKGEVSAADFAKITDGPLKTFALLGAGVRDTFGQVAAVVGPALTVLAQTFGPLLPQLVGLVSALSPLHLLFTALLPVLPQIVALAGSLAVTLGDSLAQILPVVTDLVGKLVGVIAGMAPVIADLVGGAVGMVNDFLSMPGAVDLITTALVVGGAAFLTYKGIMTGITIATNLYEGATKAAAAAQKIFNTVMKANVFVLILSAVAALVAGLIWFFTQTELGKQIVANVWSFIQGAIQAVGDWFTNTLAPAFSAAVQGIGGFFSWLYTGIIQPVFNAIAAVFTWWWQNVTMPVFNTVMGIIQAVGGWFSWLYNDILSPIFQLAGALIAWWWNNMAMPVFNTVVSFVRDTLGAIFTWLYESIIKPVFDGISAAITWVWENGIKPVFDGWVRIFTVIIPDALNWLYNTIIKPVFDGIGTAISWVWNNIIQPVFQAIQNTIDTIGSVISWLYNTIVKPQFDAIGQAIKWVWENVIKPVFDFLANTIQKDIPNAFEQGKKFIDDVWKGIQDVVKAPIRFVVETVLNDGLIGAFNNVARFLGTKELGRIALPPGFAEGGWTGPGAKYKPAGVVHADEFVFTKAQVAAAGGPRAMYGLAAMLERGYASGGLVSPLDAWTLTQGFGPAHNGLDMAAATGTPIHAAGPGIVSFAGWGANNQGGNEMHIDHPNGLQTWYAHQSRFAVPQGARVSQGETVGYVGATGQASGPHLHYMVLDGGWPNVLDPTPYLTGGGAAGTGKGGGFFNPVEGIIDGLMGQFKAAFPQGGFVVDLVGGFAKNLLHMASDAVMDLFGGRTDKGAKGSASGLLFDGGGWLEQTAGPMLVEHKRRRPDAVLTNEQWSTMQTIASNAQAGGPLVNNENVYVVDVDELARKQATSLHDALALVPAVGV